MAGHDAGVAGGLIAARRAAYRLVVRSLELATLCVV